jgi:hypothetical protein
MVGTIKALPVVLYARINRLRRVHMCTTNYGEIGRAWHGGGHRHVAGSCRTPLPTLFVESPLVSSAVFSLLAFTAFIMPAFASAGT